jgi:hypothetical protein
VVKLGRAFGDGVEHAGSRHDLVGAEQLDDDAPSIWAAMPGPGRLRGQALTMRQRRTSWAMAGVASAAVVAAATPAPARNSRLFMMSSPVVICVVPGRPFPFPGRYSPCRRARLAGFSRFTSRGLSGSSRGRDRAPHAPSGGFFRRF